jgi:hypothetical protein
MQCRSLSLSQVRNLPHFSKRRRKIGTLDLRLQKKRSHQHQVRFKEFLFYIFVTINILKSSKNIFLTDSMVTCNCKSYLAGKVVLRCL